MLACGVSASSHMLGAAILAICLTDSHDGQWEYAVARGRALIVELPRASSHDAPAPATFEIPSDPPVPRDQRPEQMAVKLEAGVEAAPVELRRTSGEPPPAADAPEAAGVKVAPPAWDLAEARKPVGRPLFEERPWPPEDVVRWFPRGSEPAHSPAASVAVVFVEPATAGAAVDQLPEKLPQNPAPDYPLEALTARREGRVRVRAVISPEGDVVLAEIETSSGTASLDASALAAVERWRFAPAMRRGVAVEFEVIVPVRFSIRRG